MSKGPSMTQREKLLALAVSATVLIIGGVFGTGRLFDAFNQREETKLRLDGASGKQLSAVKRGERAEEKLAVWRDRSLTDNQTRAR